MASRKPRSAIFGKTRGAPRRSLWKSCRLERRLRPWQGCGRISDAGIDSGSSSPASGFPKGYGGHGSRWQRFGQADGIGEKERHGMYWLQPHRTDRIMVCIRNQAFSAPIRFDVNALLAKAYARANAASDHRYFLQIDPNYMSHHIVVLMLGEGFRLRRKEVGCWTVSIFHQDIKRPICPGEWL